MTVRWNRKMFRAKKGSGDIICVLVKLRLRELP
jgi:hypothetical protein